MFTLTFQSETYEGICSQVIEASKHMQTIPLVESTETKCNNDKPKKFKKLKVDEQEQVKTPEVMTPVTLPEVSVPVFSVKAPEVSVVTLPPVTGGHTLETFKANAITVIADLVNNNKIDKNYLSQLSAYFGVTEFWEILKDEKKVAELFENLVQLGLVVKVG